ncbi:hypothetical protein [Aeromicrobium sp. IC_218]|uniref:DUF7003 family protein n=1 Tax=Aeromicrobium sp. IC_218 TaxID=2545468 RepID=UPI00103D5AD2|nr:hypothetical protein [Aeromicrobium sp. IC_218]TCI99832.1 hypothetical protein E0W78_05355 [Aeromicrobium sp. IC_218]
MIDVDGILEELDIARDGLTFFDLNHPYLHAVDCRLHAFGDGSRWALVMEHVCYYGRAFNLFDVVHAFGNCLTSGGYMLEQDDFHGRIENFAEIRDTSDFDALADGPPPRVRGRDLPLAATPGTNLVSALRTLVPEHREPLLGTDAEVRRRVPPDLPKLLQLEEWHQPELFETTPSETETFQQLAQVMATCDPGAYRPTEPPNTHWSNWPLSGSL